MSYWPPYVPVAQRRANARRKMAQLRKKGLNIQPVEIEGRVIARSFWGKSWCQHLESFSDFANRLPRGRTYARNGSVCHLLIKPGCIEAIVSGSELYDVTIKIKKLKPAIWKTITKQCIGHIGSMLELLQGKLSDQVMRVVADRQRGLFPQPGELTFNCSCPDWAEMCKHVAAVLYGVANRLDSHPEMLFLLRNVDAEELIATVPAVRLNKAAEDGLENDQLGDIFGVDIDIDTPAINSKSGVKRKNRPSPDSAQPLPKIRPTGQSVARLRKRQKLSVAEFATRLGVTAASVYRWEASPGRLSLQERPLRALARMHQQAKPKKSP